MDASERSDDTLDISSEEEEEAEEEAELPVLVGCLLQAAKSVDKASRDAASTITERL